MPRHIHLHLTIQPGSTITIGHDEIKVAPSNGETKASNVSATATSNGAATSGPTGEEASEAVLLDPTVEAAAQRLASSGSSQNVRTLVDGLHEEGYQFEPASALRAGSTPQNYMRVIDPRHSRYAVAYLTPTYIEFTRFALQLAPDLATLPGGVKRGDTGVKFSHIESARPGLDAAKLLKEQSRNAGS